MQIFQTPSDSGERVVWPGWQLDLDGLGWPELVRKSPRIEAILGLLRTE
ncbi:hypothetical protein [Kocuria sp.]|nr:hypothetical protein [Kocuria sp.]MDO5618256.1 hypothetical protein [Kocuria sp.]